MKWFDLDADGVEVWLVCLWCRQPLYNADSQRLGLGPDCARGLAAERAEALREQARRQQAQAAEFAQLPIEERRRILEVERYGQRTAERIWALRRTRGLE